MITRLTSTLFMSHVSLAQPPSSVQAVVLHWVSEDPAAATHWYGYILQLSDGTYRYLIVCTVCHEGTCTTRFAQPITSTQPLTLHEVLGITNDEAGFILPQAVSFEDCSPLNSWLHEKAI